MNHLLLPTRRRYRLNVARGVTKKSSVVTISLANLLKLHSSLYLPPRGPELFHPHYLNLATRFQTHSLLTQDVSPVAIYSEGGSTDRPFSLF